MTILVVGSIDPRQHAELVDAATGHQVQVVAGLADISGDDAVEALINVTDPVDTVLDRLQWLRWVHSGAAGVDGVLSIRLRDSPAILTSATGNGAIALAEHALMLMLMLNRDATRWVRAQADHRWDRFTHDELYGKTLGIIGLGHCGTHLAGAAAALGMDVIALTRTPRPAPVPSVTQVYLPDRLHTFLDRCDVVVITAPHTPDTATMIDDTALRSMRRTAHLICISRGGIIDDHALLQALDDDLIAGAGLDAHTVEPLPPNSPFWTHPKVIITPHNGATTRQTAERGWQILLDNVRRFTSGRTLANIVDKDSGY